MRYVLYSFKEHNKINGTLFYCFEYYAFARKLAPETLFIIHNISESDLKNIISLFRNKYEFDPAILEGIKVVNSVHELYLVAKAQKCMILDIDTFDKLYYFVKGEIVCFSNYGHSMKRSEVKNITYYGEYYYQRFDRETKLKINFNLFKKIRFTTENAVFVSSRLYNYDDIELPESLSHMKRINKIINGHYDNLYELFDTVYYFHSALDTNNRIIPEAFFYQKNIVIEYNDLPKDSVYFRYEDIKKNGLANYTLDENDIMLKHFLE